MDDTALASALRRDRWIVIIALLMITALALGYTYWLATRFDMSGMMSPDYLPWSARYFAFLPVPLGSRFCCLRRWSRAMDIGTPIVSRPRRSTSRLEDSTN